MGSIPYGRTPQRLTLGPATTALVSAGPNVPSAAIDLRSDFGVFLDSYSQRVVLQRLNLNVHCTQCWNEVNGEGDPRCIYCMGRGYESTFEIQQSRRMSSLNEHRQQLSVQASPGQELVDEEFWFFAYNVNPQEEDYVYEVTWADPAQTMVDHLLMAYKITYSFPFRGIGGRIEFWRTSALGRPIDRAVMSENLQLVLATQLNFNLKNPTVPPSV